MNWFQRYILRKLTTEYWVKLCADETNVTTLSVFAVVERNGQRIYFCKPSATFLSSWQLTHSELYYHNTLIERTPLPRSMVILRGDSVHFFHVRQS